MHTRFLLNLIIVLATFFQQLSFAQNDLVEKLLNENKKFFGNILNEIDSYEVQIIYTQINRDENNNPSFRTFTYRLDPKNYYYPASTVKLPVSILALEKINNLKIAGLNKITSLKVDSVRAPQSSVIKDSSSENGLPSISHYIKKILLLSDNDAYNRLYEFVGQKEINQGLHDKGFNDVKIVHRFASGFNNEENRYTNPITFYDGFKIIYYQPLQYNEINYSFELNNTLKGKGYIDSQNNLISQPFDFSGKNYLSLETLTEILKSVIFPEVTDHTKKFQLTESDYHFLYKYLSMYPRESSFPKYDSSYHDNYVKYFMFNESNKENDSIRFFNKVGMAYGFLTDASYIVDFKNKIEFILSAVIHVNKNRIYNDGIYEYSEIGLPFFSNLGKVFYDYELKREKKFLPNLEKFRINYR